MCSYTCSFPGTEETQNANHPKAARELESTLGSPGKGTGTISGREPHLVPGVGLGVQLNCCAGDGPDQTGPSNPFALLYSASEPAVSTGPAWFFHSKMFHFIPPGYTLVLRSFLLHSRPGCPNAPSYLQNAFFLKKNELAQDCHKTDLAE